MLFIGGIGLVGCQPADETLVESERERDAARASEDVVAVRSLRVLVVGDTNLGEVAQREWLAVSDTPLELTHISLDAFREQLETAATESLHADAVIYPTAWLGTLAEGKRIAPMPRRVRESGTFAEADLFPWVRRGEVVWGETTFAVPLGSVTLGLVARVPSPAANAKTIPSKGATVSALPKTWDALRDWRGDSTRIAQPLGEGWAAFSHLARAAAYVRNRGQVSTLFDFRTMRPLIDSPPYVRALEELVEATKTLPEQVDWTPWDIQRALKKGQCDIGLTWMSPAPTIADGKEEADGKEVVWLFSESPGSRDVYRASESAWGTHPDSVVARVPLVGMSGRVGSVLSDSRRQRAAWSFLSRISSGELSSRVSSASRSTGPFRASQQAARSWVDREIGSTGAKEYGVAMTTAYSRNLVFQTLRIPGHEAYLRSLDKAVRSAAQGTGEPTELLQQVAIEWQEITEDRGLEQQRAAYARNLGMAP